MNISNFLFMASGFSFGGLFIMILSDNLHKVKDSWPFYIIMGLAGILFFGGGIDILN